MVGAPKLGALDVSREREARVRDKQTTKARWREAYCVREAPDGELRGRAALDQFNDAGDTMIRNGGAPLGKHQLGFASLAQRTTEVATRQRRRLPSSLRAELRALRRIALAVRLDAEILPDLQNPTSMLIIVKARMPSSETIRVRD
jgi:hypothetical protein